MTTHQCSMSPTCKSTECSHAKPHHPTDCDSPAPCGSWPGNRSFQPRVICIPKAQVMPRADCPECGKKEAIGHHPQDCINELKRQLKAKEVQRD